MLVGIATLARFRGASAVWAYILRLAMDASTAVSVMPARNFLRFRPLAAVSKLLSVPSVLIGFWGMVRIPS